MSGACGLRCSRSPQRLRCAAWSARRSAAGQSSLSPVGALQACSSEAVRSELHRLRAFADRMSVWQQYVIAVALPQILDALEEDARHG